MGLGTQTGEGLLAAAAATPLPTPEAVCAHLARCFHVRQTEIALLRLEGAALKFLWPRALANIGSIPMTSSALAARTARSRRAELSNCFVSVPHGSVFESVRLNENDNNAPMAIQKVMSVPIISGGDTVVGVVQISRKGATQQAAGPDFGADDLQRLKQAAAEIAPTMSLMSLPDRTLSGKVPICDQSAERADPRA